jgi:hypothetical protein
MLFRKGIHGRFPWLSTYAIWAGALILLAIALRIVLTAKGWPLLDSDEGTMGLMGMHIAFRGEHPIFFYAQGYMGATEAYLAALMFRLFGVSSFTLRLGLILIFALFMLGMYLLTSLLYTKKLALLTLALLALGSNPMLMRELIAVGGVPETWLAGTFLLLLTAWLALSSSQDASMRNRWQRLLAYGAWGLAAGFGLWSHMLILPFILVGGVILLLFCWRELLSWAPLCLLAGLLIGSSPLISYNLTAPPGKDTLFYAVHAMEAGGTPQLPLHVLLPMQIKGVFLISLPTVTGANPLCYGSVSDVHLLSLGSSYGLRCTFVHTAWPLGVVLLWLAAFALAIRSLWRLRLPSTNPSISPDRRKEAIRYSLHLALLINGAIPVLLYTLSPNSAFYPVATSRYMVGILVSIPAILWPLVSASNVVKPLALRVTSQVTLALRLARLSVVVKRGVLVLILLVFLLGVYSTFTGLPATPAVDQLENVYYTQVSTQHLAVPAVQALNQQENALIRDLLRLGAKHIYSDYWTCDRLIFQSRERVICSAVQDNLTPGHNRYAPYSTIVKADPAAAYAFYAGSQPDRIFAQRMTSSDEQYRRFKQYRRLLLDGYAVYIINKT